MAKIILHRRQREGKADVDQSVNNNGRGKFITLGQKTFPLPLHTS